MGNPVKYLDREPAFAGGVPIPPLSDDAAANRLLGRNANAFLIGLVLDQQIASEKAFTGPAVLRKRLGHLNVRKIADMPQEEFAEAMSAKPAVHRFPASMGKRVQDACRVLNETYSGKAANIWKDQPDAKTVMKRIGVIPGIGPAKQKLAVMLLGRYYGCELEGWMEEAPAECRRLLRVAQRKAS